MASCWQLVTLVQFQFFLRCASSQTYRWADLAVLTSIHTHLL